MELTPFARGVMIAVIFAVLCNFLAFFYFFIILGLSLTIAYLVTGTNKDIDVFAAMCINHKGLIPPKINSVLPPMTQNCVIYFEKNLNWNETKQFIIDKLFCYKRLISIGYNKKSSPVWNTKWKKVEINDQLINELLQCQQVNGDDALYEKIEVLCNQQISVETPQWRFILINNSNGLSAVLLRVSHGIADGLRLVALVTDLFEDANGNPIKVPTVGKMKVDDAGNSNNKNDKFKINWFNPRTYINIIKDLKGVNDMMYGQFDTITPFKPDYSIHCPPYQRIFRSKTPISLNDLKKIKNHYRVSINDVLTAAFAGSVRNYILTQNPKFFETQKTNINMRAMVAFGFPLTEEFHRQYDWLRNDFTFVSWPIPIQYAEFSKRVERCFSNANKLKKSLQAIFAKISTTLIASLGLDFIIEDGTTNGMQRHSCIFSNVPGFEDVVYFQKQKVVKVEASYLNVIPQILMVSYNQNVYTTLACDHQYYSNAQDLIDYMNKEIETIVKQIK